MKCNLRTLFLLFLNLFLFLSPRLTQGQSTSITNLNPIPVPPPKGICAWVYDQSQHWVDLINAYNTTISSQPGGEPRKFRYLFPKGGEMKITGPTYTKPYTNTGCNFYYSSKVSQYYASRLPGIYLLPSIDCVDGATLATWSSDDQQKLAEDVAKAINDDPNAAGVQIDLEPIKADKNLPFFEKLRPLLNSKGKLLSVYGWDFQGKLFYNIDIMVPSGYDSGIKSITLVRYQKYVHDLVSKALWWAQKSGCYVLVGVPGGASAEEYAYQTGAHTSNTGYTQKQWFQTALNEICPYMLDEHYLGLSLWGLNEISKEKLQNTNLSFKQPVEMPESNWKTLENTNPFACKTPTP